MALEKAIEDRILHAENNQINLQALGVDDSNLGEIIELILRFQPNTEQIILDGNQIQEAGATLLGSTLHNLVHLHFLGLQNNDISHEGIEKLYQLKNHLPHLTFALCGNLITDEGEMLEIERQYPPYTASTNNGP
jgi:hypothetical protein